MPTAATAFRPALGTRGKRRKVAVGAALGLLGASLLAAGGARYYLDAGSPPAGPNAGAPIAAEPAPEAPPLAEQALARAEAPVSSPSAATPVEPLPYEARGTVAGSHAVLEHLPTGTQGLFRLNDDLPPDGVIVAITRTEVFVERPGGTEVLRVKPGDGAAAETDGGETGENFVELLGLHRTSEHGGTIRKDRIPSAGAGLAAELQRFTNPLAKVHQVADGVLLFNVEENGLLRQLGVRDADVLKSINGISLEGGQSPGFLLVPMLGRADDLELVVRRGEDEVTLSYEGRES